MNQGLNHTLKKINELTDKYETIKSTLTTKFPLESNDTILLIDEFITDLNYLKKASLDSLIPVYEMDQLAEAINGSKDPNAPCVLPIDFITFN